MDNNKEVNFQKLTPSDDADLLVYKDAIDYIFDNKDVRNIAISGSYGAGKSSLINSYKNLKDNKIKFLHVSLAHFKESDINDKNKGEITESDLEGKIINQLIHQIPAKNIPQTNFKVKKKFNKFNISYVSILVMLFLVSLLHIFMFKPWSTYVSNLPNNLIQSVLNISLNKSTLLISATIIFLTLFKFVYFLVKVQKTKNLFKRFKLQGNEIEIFEENDESSYFDKYLNEVLYLFENVDADVIVFEDIDRFEMNGIFERLHEINTLVNFENKKTLRFFYLLRDDIFTSKDRTKFFDYILPVVPVMDSSNSYDKFIEILKEGSIYSKFDESFLQGLSLYVDDMRILKNIYNEFLIYFNRLNTIELNYNNMLAMITYKNLFPRDFSQLQLNQGMVYSLFIKKNEFIENEIKELDKSLEEKEEQILYIKKEHLNSIEELDIVYSYRKNQISYNNSYSRRLQKEEEYNEELNKRKKAIENKLSNDISSLENQKLSIKEKIKLIQHKRLKEIITRDNIDDIFKITIKNQVEMETNFNDIKSSEYFDLLKYLIRNGFIDETYSDYMTYFYEDSLSRIDKTFLRSVLDRKAKEYTFKLENPKLIVQRLSEVEFDQEEVLNFDLLDHLLKTKNNYLISKIIKQLKDNQNLDFIWSYFDERREQATFVENVNREWPEMLYETFHENQYSDESIKQYSLYTLYYSNEKEIDSMNSKEFLSEYISSDNNYLDINSPKIDMIIQKFSLLNVSFVSINNANDDLLKGVYNNSLYKITFENLKLMIRHFYGVIDDEQLRYENYTLIRSKPNSPLDRYVNEKIETYLDLLISFSNGKIIDDEEDVKSMLNRKELSSEQKKSYVNSLKTKISAIKEINDKEIWDILLEKELINYSEENLLEYFLEKSSLEYELSSFINNNEKILDFKNVIREYTEDQIDDFYNSCIVSNDLSDTKYREIVHSFNFNFSDFDEKEINENKMNILFEEKTIEMNMHNLLFVRENYPKCVIHFIKLNTLEYKNIITSDTLIYDELKEILKWDLDDKYKIDLLDLKTDSISIIGEGYPSEINIHILKNNLDKNEIPYYFADYESWNLEEKDVIFKLILENISNVIDSPKGMSHELFCKIILSNALDYNLKIDLFVSLLSIININRLDQYLELLNLEIFKRIFKQNTRPSYEVNELNKKVLTEFKNNNWIDDFYENPKKANFYKVIKIKKNLFSN